MILQVGAVIAQPQGPPGAAIASGSAKSAREPCQNGLSQRTVGGDHTEETRSALLDTEASLNLSDEDDEPRGTQTIF